MMETRLKTQLKLTLKTAACVSSLMLLGLMVTPAAGWADCRANGDQAMDMLSNVKRDALNNQKLDSARFKADFGRIIQQLQAENCNGELLRMSNFIQQEQRLYPAPGGMARQN